MLSAWSVQICSRKIPGVARCFAFNFTSSQLRSVSIETLLEELQRVQSLLRCSSAQVKYQKSYQVLGISQHFRPSSTFLLACCSHKGATQCSLQLDQKCISRDKLSWPPQNLLLPVTDILGQLKIQLRWSKYVCDLVLLACVAHFLLV